MTIPALCALTMALLAILPTGGAAAQPAPEPPPISAYSYARQAQSVDALVRAASNALLATAPDAELTRLARMLEMDHGRSAARFGRWTGGAAEPQLLGADARRLRKLERVVRERQDDELLEELIEIHEDALALHEAYARSGAHPDLRRAAALAAPAVAGHLAELRRLEAAQN